MKPGAKHPVWKTQSFIRAFFETFNQRDLDKMDHLLSSDAEFYFPKTQPLIAKKDSNGLRSTCTLVTNLLSVSMKSMDLKLWIKSAIRILKLKLAHRGWHAC